mgnify:CR=1 FL=1
MERNPTKVVLERDGVLGLIQKDEAKADVIIGVVVVNGSRRGVRGISGTRPTEHSDVARCLGDRAPDHGG